MRIILAAYLMLFPVLGSAYSQPLFIIASKESSLNAITIEQVARIYLGHPTLSDNFKVTPVDYDESLELTRSFRERVLRKNAVEYRRYWARLIFSGKATPPVADMRDEEMMLEFVLRNKNSIGYVSKKQNAESAKILAVIDL